MAAILVLIATLAKLPILAHAEQFMHNADEAAEQLKRQFDAAISANNSLSWSFIQPTYIQSAGFAVRYCFEFEHENERDYLTILNGVSNYRGQLRWSAASMFNGKGACIGYVPTEEISAFFRGTPSRTIDIATVQNDAAALTQYLRTLPMSGASHTRRAAAAGLPNEYSPGMHKIYVLLAPENGIYSERHPSDRMLNFSPTGSEWSRMILSLQGVDFSSSEAASFQGLQAEIPEFPLLSRIAGPYDWALYSISDLPKLKLECQAALTRVQDETARSAVDKILLAVRWAEHLRSGLLLVPTD
jgi:hypothetical protein